MIKTQNKMEENKVILDLQTYENLKEHEKAVTEDNFIFYEHYSGRYFSLKENEVIDKLKNENEYLLKVIDQLKNPKHKNTLEDLKNMNLFSVIKWKLSRKK